MWRHPNYYKELRKLRNKEARRVLGCLPTNELYNSDQVISGAHATAKVERAPDPGQKLQAAEDSTAKRVAEPEASSVKPQATQDSSDKHQAPSPKRQAPSRKRQAL